MVSKNPHKKESLYLIPGLRTPFFISSNEKNKIEPTNILSHLYWQTLLEHNICPEDLDEIIIFYAGSPIEISILRESFHLKNTTPMEIQTNLESSLPKIFEYSINNLDKNNSYNLLVLTGLFDPLLPTSNSTQETYKLFKRIYESKSNTSKINLIKNLKSSSWFKEKKQFATQNTDEKYTLFQELSRDVHSITLEDEKDLSRSFSLKFNKSCQDDSRKNSIGKDQFLSETDQYDNSIDGISEAKKTFYNGFSSLILSNKNSIDKFKIKNKAKMIKYKTNFDCEIEKSFDRPCREILDLMDGDLNKMATISLYEISTRFVSTVCIFQKFLNLNGLNISKNQINPYGYPSYSVDIGEQSITLGINNLINALIENQNRNGIFHHALNEGTSLTIHIENENE